MDERGQVMPMVGTAVTLIVSLVVGIIVVNQFFIATPLMGATTYETDQLLNTAFTDNTGDVPDYWDNIATDNRLAYYDGTNNWIYDNGDNGTVDWYQSLVVGSFDTVVSATIQAKYMLGDNTGLTNLTARVKLERPSDNVTIWQTTSLDNSTGWVSIENNIKSYITAAGTYKIRLWENVLTTMDNNNYIYWDDASLTVRTSLTTVDPTAQATYDNTQILAWAGIGLMALAIVVLAAVAILSVVRSGLSTGGEV